jgi:DNA-binding NarL/FixJ family response regulator
MSIKVAIVEDHTSVRESLGVLVKGSSNFRLTGSFPNAETALKEISIDWPDVVLMDINLPNMSGIDCVGKLKAMRPELHILMFTAYSDDEQIFQSLQKGASGYLLKKTEPAKILEAIVDVHAGGAPMSHAIAKRVVQHFREKPSMNETENLTKREHEILGCLAKGYQYKEIAAALSISIMTVRSHVQNIYDKLHVRSRTEAVVKFLGGNSSR